MTFQGLITNQKLSQIVGLIEDLRQDGNCQGLDLKSMLWGATAATAGYLLAISGREEITFKSVVQALRQNNFDPRFNVAEQVFQIYQTLLSHEEKTRLPYQSSSVQIKPPSLIDLNRSQELKQ